MKATYQGFQAQERKGFIDLPPAGCYEAEIQGVRVDRDYSNTHDVIVMMLEITEGEYKGRYHQVFEDQKDKFGEVKYKGTFTLTPPIDGDEPWRQKAFENNLWCVEQSNKGYHWDWDETKLKGKKVGINVRRHLFTYNGKDRENTEIARFETIEDVRAGKCKTAKERDTRDNKSEEPSTDGSGFTNVTEEVEVPF